MLHGLPQIEEFGRAPRKTAAEILPLVYHDLRQLAAAKLANERPEHTLQATALVHEAFLRLVGSGDARWDDEYHFFAAAAESMRRVLVDQARRRATKRKGGDLSRCSLSVGDPVCAEGISADDLLDLEDALADFELVEPEACKVIKLRFFSGLTNDQIGKLLGVSAKTVQRNAMFARAWLGRRIAAQHTALKSD